MARKTSVKKIKLTQEKYALVDDDDFNRVSNYKWCFDKTIGYAVSRMDGKNVRMHRFILKLSTKDICDHVNRNGLDNRKKNLRLATKSSNGANRKKQNNNTSGYKGVFLMKDGREKKYMARMRFKGKDIFIGYFYTKKDAAIAYNKKALENFGEFSYLNKI